MKKIILIAEIILLNLQLTVKAQYVIKKADKQFELYNYHSAVAIYEQAWKRKETKHTAARLAFCYKMQQDYKQSESWAAIAALHPNSKAEDVLNYAKALQENAKYSEAKIQYHKYWKLDQKVNPELVGKWIQSCDSAVRWMKEASTVEMLNDKGLNSPQSEWGLVRNGTDFTFDYQLSGKKTGFRNDLAKFSTKGLPITADLSKDIYLTRIVISQAIRIENIYYDFDQTEIRPDTARELDKLVKIMKDNPTLWIELGSHIDSRGDDEYNLKLSQRRADAMVQYLVNSGVEKNRLTAVGYGETMLLNKCANGVNCTEEQHQLNRRTEFKIVK